MITRSDFEKLLTEVKMLKREVSRLSHEFVVSEKKKVQHDPWIQDIKKARKEVKKGKVVKLNSVHDLDKPLAQLLA